MPYNVGDHVLFTPHYRESMAFGPQPYYVVHTKLTSEASWRAPVISYGVARMDDPEGTRRVETCVREEMLTPVEELSDAPPAA